MEKEPAESSALTEAHIHTSNGVIYGSCFSGLQTPNEQQKDRLWSKEAEKPEDSVSAHNFHPKVEYFGPMVKGPIP